MRAEGYIFASMLFSLSACASALTAEERAEQLNTALYADDPRRGEEVSRICFAANIDGFSQTTDRAVVVREGLQDYLVTTRHRCTDLDHAFSLQMKSHSACLQRGDKLIGSESAFGQNRSGHPELSCLVDKIYQWDADAGATSDVSEAPA